MIGSIYDSMQKPAFVLMKKYIERSSSGKIGFVYQSIGS
jgi:hypothetical protein